MTGQQLAELLVYQHNGGLSQFRRPRPTVATPQASIPRLKHREIVTEAENRECCRWMRAHRGKRVGGHDKRRRVTEVGTGCRGCR